MFLSQIQVTFQQPKNQRNKHMTKTFFHHTLTYSFFLITLSQICFLAPPLIHAQNATNSADTQEVKDNIKERIRKVVETGSESNVDISSLQQKGWLGSIESISGQTITISSSGINRLVATSTETSITQDKTFLNLEDLIIGSTMVAVGIVDSTDILTASQVIISKSTPQPSNKVSVLATIESVDLKSNNLTITPSNKSQDMLLSISKNTQLSEYKSDDVDTILKPENLRPLDQALIVYQPTSKDPSTLSALIIHRIYSSPAPSPSASDN